MGAFTVACWVMNAKPIVYPSRLWQSLAALWVVVSLVLCMASPACAAVQEVRVVAVGMDDVSGIADEKALDYARKRAVYLTARQLGGADAGFKASKLNDDQLSQIIRGTKVIQSRREGNVTYADVNVTLVEEALRKILSIAPSVAAVPEPVVASGHGVLVLPVFVGEERPYLWEKENQLRAPLAEEVLRQSHGAVLVAAGDFEDLRLVDAKNILTVKASELQPMFARYGSREIIVAVLTLSPAGKEAPSSVLLRRLRLGSSHNEVIDVPPVSVDEKTDARFHHAVVVTATALTQIAASTADVDQERLKKATSINVRFLYATSRELGQLQQAVRSAKGVLALEMPAISLKEISGTIYFEGEKSMLQEVLKKQNIMVRESADGWIVSVR